MHTRVLAPLDHERRANLLAILARGTTPCWLPLEISVNSTPNFFVPAASNSDQAEHVYASLATSASCSVPEPGKRIYSITFRSRNETWTATVGEALSGTTDEVRDRRGNIKKRSSTVGDPAIVVAMFPGVPFRVFTNHGLDGVGVGSRWANPLLAGGPVRVEYFADANEGT